MPVETHKCATCGTTNPKYLCDRCGEDMTGTDYAQVQVHVPSQGAPTWLYYCQPCKDVMFPRSGQ